MPRLDIQKKRTSNSSVLKKIVQHDNIGGGCFFCAPYEGCNAGRKPHRPRPDKYKSVRKGRA